jgi:hypothetical protein
MTSDDASLTEEDATVTDQVTANNLSVDLLANIFGFLGGISDIMQKRRVSKKWKEAVKMTVVPLCDFYINSMKRYNAMSVMTRAMPNLQRIAIGELGYPHKYSDGEDPDEEYAARYARQTAHDIEIISNFSKLRSLAIFNYAMNGRYPVLFNSFPLLQRLSIQNCSCLKWDLENLAGFPLLKEVDCVNSECLIGNINSLRVLKDTLKKVEIRDCSRVEGNFMDLADFPCLKELNLRDTPVTGDIRDIGENDFSSLEQLSLPKGVYGGMGYEFQLISDALDLVRAVYLFHKQRPGLIDIASWYGHLSEDSPNWYESVDESNEFVDYSILH